MKIKIWEVRSSKGITLVSLSEMTGISKSALNNFENQKRSPKLQQLEQIAIALGCKITDLFDSEHK